MGMSKITSASWAKKLLLNKLASYDPLSLSISYSTLSISFVWLLGLTTLKVYGVGIHLSLQILTFFPFPTIQRDPLSITSLAASSLLHTYEGLRPRFASMKLLPTKHFASSILWVMEFGFCCICHPYLARSARLKALKSLNPMPPFDFGMCSFSHEIQAIFLSLSFCPH